MSFAIISLIVFIASYIIIDQINPLENDNSYVKFFKKLTIILWILLVMWYTRKFYLESYFPTMLTETFSE